MKSIASEALRQKGIDEAKIVYAKLLKERGNDYGLNKFEYEFSQLCYSLVLSDHLNAAIEVYKLNIGGFPNSSKAFEDLGVAYHKRGQRTGR
jgi:tetratricopeptide (TPR) repeat protein